MTPVIARYHWGKHFSKDPIGYERWKQSFQKISEFCKFVKTRFSAPGGPLFIIVTLWENKLVGVLKKKLKTPKMRKITFWGPPQMLSHLYKLGTKNDSFLVFQKSHQNFQECEKFQKNDPQGPPKNLLCVSEIKIWGLKKIRPPNEKDPVR